MKPWDESAGYDCITPGIEIQDAQGHTVVVVDAKDYGWNACGLGRGVAEHQEKVHRQVYDTAASIIRNHNNSCGGNRFLLLGRPGFGGERIKLSPFSKSAARARRANRKARLSR
jgi:hypothetical protein